MGNCSYNGVVLGVLSKSLTHLLLLLFTLSPVASHGTWVSEEGEILGVVSVGLICSVIRTVFLS